MSLHEWADLLLHQMKETDVLQWLAVILGVAEVLLAKSNKIALYPVGIAGTLLSVYILILAGLYAESLLNGYYLVMSVYGWWYWLKKKNQPAVKITYCERGDWIKMIWIVAGGFILLFILLKSFTNSSVPVWDAWVSATAWAGMWLLAKRKIENWILLNISNLFAIPLLVYKKLPLFAALTLFLFVVAVFGYFEWRKIIHQEKLSLV
jgi:nicotinamide mononucleotide transporter